MDDADYLQRELRAAREELIRKTSDDPEGGPVPESRLPLMPDRDEEFLRLAVMTADELEVHVDRLERDLDDLRNGIAAVDRDPDTDTE